MEGMKLKINFCVLLTLTRTKGRGPGPRAALGISPVRSATQSYPPPVPHIRPHPGVCPGWGWGCVGAQPAAASVRVCVLGPWGDGTGCGWGRAPGRR